MEDRERGELGSPPAISHSPSAAEVDALIARCDQSPPDRATKIARAFVQQWPRDPSGWMLLAENHYRLGAYQDAASAAEEVSGLCPQSASAHSNLAVMLKKLERFNDAEVALRRALQCDPEFIAAYVNLGNVLRELDRFPEAEALFRRALVLDPHCIEALNNLANVFKESGRLEEAEGLYRQVIAQAPNNPEAHSNLGVLFIEQGRPQDAEPMLRRAIVLDPTDVMSHANLGLVLADLDRAREAEIACRQALAIDPTHAMSYGNLLYLLAYTGRCSGEAMRVEARNWGQAVFATAEAERWQRSHFVRSSAHNRPLRVGVLSAEFGAHVVARFLDSWLWQLDPARIDLRLYPCKLHPDSSAEVFAAKAPAWMPVVGLSDAQAAERLRADELDVLIETSGHTADNRLGILARRVAPVQCHYIGYFGSTGLSSMDYFIADEVLIPPQHDGHFVERVWRLPRTRYAYQPVGEGPAPVWLPDPEGRLWLGSFNNLAKVREQTLTLWAGVMRAIPNSMLLLKDGKAIDPLVQARILRTLGSGGIPRERVAFHSKTPDWSSHMALYNHVDIALDTLPFNSSTTACDALWMGCPLVTLIGDQLAGRQAASILTGLGRSDWIAKTENDFIDIVRDLARDPQRRRAIRENQREQMRASELCDGAGLARVLEDALQEMFDRWFDSTRC